MKVDKRNTLASKSRGILADQADRPDVVATYNNEQLKQAARGVIQGVLSGEYTNTADDAKQRMDILLDEAERRANA